MTGSSGPLEKLPKEDRARAIAQAAHVLDSTMRRKILLYLLDFPASTATDIRRSKGFARPDGTLRLNHHLHIELDKCIRGGFVVVMRSSARKPNQRAYNTRYRVSAFGEKWMRVLLDDGELRSSAFPRETDASKLPDESGDDGYPGR